MNFENSRIWAVEQKRARAVIFIFFDLVYCNGWFYFDFAMAALADGWRDREEIRKMQSRRNKELKCNGRFLFLVSRSFVRSKWEENKENAFASLAVYNTIVTFVIGEWYEWKCTSFFFSFWICIVVKRSRSASCALKGNHWNVLFISTLQLNNGGNVALIHSFSFCVSFSVCRVKKQTANIVICSHVDAFIC